MNIGMVLGLLPAMGIPLPFMSSGGSALMTNYAIVGLMMNGYRSRL
ncbi:MAG: FtsW/RodA/SpoVE family cell cycle protein [Chloroherpetonaceae bacterium]